MAWGGSPFHRVCDVDGCEERVNAPPSIPDEKIRCFDHAEELEETSRRSGNE